MRTRINTIIFTPGTRSINTGITDLTIDDIRLFINESQMKVICSSMQKDNIDSIVSGVVTYKDTFPVLVSGDHITFEIDKGDNIAKEATVIDSKLDILDAIGAIPEPDLSPVAKQGTNPNTSLTAVDNKIDNFYGTFDADIALQLQGIIGDTEESVGGSSQTVTEVERLRTLQESYDMLSDDLQALSDNLQTMVNKRNQLGEYIFADDFAANNISDIISHRNELVSVRDENITKLVGPCFSRCSHLQSIDLPNLTEITYYEINNTNNGGCFYNDIQLRSINLPNITHIYGWDVFSGLANLEVLELPNLLIATDGTYLADACSNLKSIKLPSLRVLNIGQAFWNCTELRELYIPNIDSNAQYVYLASNIFNANCTKVIDITIGRYIQKNFNLNSWNPTEALLTTSQSLLTSEDIAAGFTTNREKLLYNIREHIAANLPDRTGLSSLTMTVSANIKAAINGDTATADAFANKNWVIA